MDDSNRNAWICDAIRTPIGRYGGALASARPDDLGVVTLKAIMERHDRVDWGEVNDVIFGCANQAGEDNRNIARMVALLAGLPERVPAVTVNRLCASGLEAVSIAARAIKAGEARMCLAGGVESMSRAPFAMLKSTQAFHRYNQLVDTTLGWRFAHPDMATRFGIDSMPETGENVAERFGVSREDQDAFALRSQARAKAGNERGFFKGELVSVTLPRRKGDPIVVDADEHPRPDTSAEGLARLKPFVKPDGTITAGNASGINDGACALLVANDDAVSINGFEPLARVVATVAVGVPPRIMGIGPAPAISKLLERTGVALADIDTIEINEAFASQSLACLRELGLPDDAAHVNPNGGAIALGHPLGMSGARLITTATRQLAAIDGRFAICSMCVGVGQGVAMLLERPR
ncbi:3-oxoadipyl-CoA thiolase [Candidatus Pelagisphaera phototrophica]|uniref:3-oxoadipyl-CoA thiolase n=1 Tax=Candidatus Pelagisphaera phototrophica TaxID=2684113 RepID=UPI0019F4FCE1|nr:3-oxoadipyl-CoA thiolase [Candidatus Pelagisphaera phototrophica]QXD31360.1 3-oxoadipyl-CoA thiolase [Candidatus Pelagisphaera phototrophica]